MNYVLPVIGSSGIFTFAAPFNAVTQPDERLFCRAIRSIADYLASNEDPFKDIYQPAGLTDLNFNDDVAENMYIVSFQNGEGRWLYIPARYVTKFPEVNGHPYVFKNFVISLPAIPTALDISFVSSQLESLITNTLGLPSKVKVVNNSREIMVTPDNHETREMNRRTVINGQTTDSARYIKLTQDYQALQQRYEALEQYVMNNP